MTKSRFSERSAALRLITTRGEGLSKIISPTPFIDQKEDIFDQKWDFHFGQILDPQGNRPKRRVISDPSYAWDPLEQKEVTPEELLDEKSEISQSSTTMTSTTLLPRDNKMALFGTQTRAGCGILYDLRLCDLKNERFVFAEDALTDNDWFFNPDDKNLKQQFSSQKINDLRVSTNLEEEASGRLRDYNEILSGLNAKAMSAILLQPPTSEYAAETPEQALASRIYAITRKLYAADNINRHLPIIIYDTKHAAYEYTFEMQQQDLQLYMKDHAPAASLLEENKHLNEHMPVEHESNEAPQLIDSLDSISKRRQLIREAFILANEKMELLREIYDMSFKFSELDENDDVEMDMFKERKDVLIDLYSKNRVALHGIKAQLEGPEFKIDSPRMSFQQFKEKRIAVTQTDLRFEPGREERAHNRRESLQAARPSFWSRHKFAILGVVLGIVIAGAAIAASIFTFGIAPMVAAIGIVGLACGGGGLGVLGGIVGAVLDRVFRPEKKQKKKFGIARPELKESLLVEQKAAPDADGGKARRKKVRVAKIENVVPEKKKTKHPASYQPIFLKTKTTAPEDKKKEASKPEDKSRPGKRRH